jgi:simple sugar transport system permease protein/ribose transport system permease protein
MIVLAKTRYGRETQLVGANREAARASGLRVGFTIAMAFVISAVMAGVCGIIVASQFGQGTTNQFPGFNIDVIAAVLVGGTAVQGGDGSALRTAVGALSIALLQNLMVLRDYSFGVRTLVVGAAVLVGAVIYHRLRSSLR